MVALALQMSLGGQSDGCCWEAKECCPLRFHLQMPEMCKSGGKMSRLQRVCEIWNDSELSWLKLRHLLVGAAKNKLGYVRITQAQ